MPRGQTPVRPSSISSRGSIGGDTPKGQGKLLEQRVSLLEARITALSATLNQVLDVLEEVRKKVK